MSTDDYTILIIGTGDEASRLALIGSVHTFAGEHAEIITRLDVTPGQDAPPTVSMRVPTEAEIASELARAERREAEAKENAIEAQRVADEAVAEATAAASRAAEAHARAAAPTSSTDETVTTEVGEPST